MKRRKQRSASALMGGVGRNLAVRSGGGTHRRPQDKRAKQKLARMMRVEAP
jgi:hypothetical protein